MVITFQGYMNTFTYQVVQCRLIRYYKFPNNFLYVPGNIGFAIPELYMYIINSFLSISVVKCDAAKWFEIIHDRLIIRVA